MKFLKYHLPFLLWLIIIFIESSIPATEYPKIEIWGADKIVHMGVYGLLTALCYISLIHQEKFPLLLKNTLLFSVIISSFYGATDEFHQLFVFYRDCEFWDWLANFAGALIMALLIKYYLSRKFSIFKRRETPTF
jgi:VanZ family protein